MARSVHKLADTELPHQIEEDLNKELKLQAGPIAQSTIVPGSAESRQVQQPKCAARHACFHCIGSYTATAGMIWVKPDLSPTRHKLCRAAAGLLVAMARSSHQDAEDDTPQDLPTDMQQAESVQTDVTEQPTAQQNSSALM